jgi:hypothetical protein
MDQGAGIVKLSQFYDLCDREWAKPRRGDVVSLCLTEASREELAIDAIACGAPAGYPLLAGKSELAGIAAGAAVSTILNPVTRTVAAIRAQEGRRPGHGAGQGHGRHLPPDVVAGIFSRCAGITLPRIRRRPYDGDMTYWQATAKRHGNEYPCSRFDAASVLTGIGSQPRTQQVVAV